MGARGAVGDARSALSVLRARLLPGGRMTPGYLVVGTKRGGSTSLADWIAEHPEVGPCRVGKGTHYFDIHHGRGRAWYDAQFPRQGQGYTITGESSPYYMFHPRAAAWIADELPGVKVVACLRDPVERAFSHHAYEVARGHESEPFERALDLEPDRLRGEVERLLADPAYPAHHYRYHAYLQRGHYAEQIATFQDLLGPERVLVVKSEALFADPEAQLARVHDFLGLAHHRNPDRAALNAGRPNGAMSGATRDRLRSYYRPLNAHLYALPGVDLRWDDVPPAPMHTHHPSAPAQAQTGVA